VPCVSALVKLRTAGERLCICLQVVIEYWAVATRPLDANGLGRTVEETARRVEEFERAFDWLDESPGVSAAWLELARRYAVSGKQVHDARLAALMRTHQVGTVLTLNSQDLARYEGITPLDPHVA
jgi:predicted nucleic acid-binding protein